MSQIELFAIEPELPEGFVYTPELISHQEEQALVRAIEQLEFAKGEDARRRGETARSPLRTQL